MMLRDEPEVNISELGLSKINISECQNVGGSNSCTLCTTIDYWVEGPIIFTVCLAGILGQTSIDALKIYNIKIFHTFKLCFCISRRLFSLMLANQKNALPPI